MAILPALPSLSKYLWMPELLCHPWSIHGWPPCIPFPLCLSICGCQSYCVIHGASMDGWPPCLPFPLCLSIRGCQSYCAIHGASMDGRPPCLPFPLCLSIRGCQSYCTIHGASMDGRPPCLLSAVKAGSVFFCANLYKWRPPLRAPLHLSNYLTT